MNLRKKILTAAIALSLVTFSGPEANGLFGPNMKKIAQQVDEFVAKDDLDEAKALLMKYENKLKNDSLWKTKLQFVNSITASKDNYSRGKKLYELKNFSASLEVMSKVISQDKIRYQQAQKFILDLKSWLLNDYMTNAKSLFNQKKYEDALEKLVNAKQFMSGSNTEFEQLYQKVKPLADNQREVRIKKQNEAERKRILRIKAALKSMKVNTDKFDGRKFYQDRSTPYYQDNNAFYLYIGKASGSSEPYLRFVVRYSDDDWLFVKTAEINIDGQTQDLDVGYDWETDNEGGEIWEWVDVLAESNHIELIKEVIKSKKAIIRFYGSQYRDDVTISSSQKRALQNVLDAYEALLLD